MASQYCRNCGKEVTQGAYACLNCGLPPMKGSNYCYNCGANSHQDAVICIKCGIRLEARTSQTYPNALVQNQSNVESDLFRNKRIPKTWLLESILVTLFCCLPLGIVGIVNASKVESKFYAGDTDGAVRASEEAKKWTTLGFWIGLILGIIYIIVIAAAGTNDNW